jgi:hypothetical protein
MASDANNIGQQMQPYVRPSAEEQVESLKSLVAKRGQGIPLWRGVSGGEARRMVQNPNDFPVGSNQDDDLETDMKRGTNMYGQGTYFSNSPHLAGIFATKHTDPAILFATHTDNNPLLIPTGTPESPFIAHPDQKVISQALDTFDNLYPHLKRFEEERLPTTVQESRPSLFNRSQNEPVHQRNEGETDDEFRDRVISQRLQGWHDLRARLEQGDSTEIARLGRRMGYRSTMVNVHRPILGVPPEEQEQLEVVAHTPDAVRLAGATRVPRLAPKMVEQDGVITRDRGLPLNELKYGVSDFLRSSQSGFDFTPGEK